MEDFQTNSEQLCESGKIKNAIIKTFDFLMQHDGAGRMEINVKLLKRGQKEVLIQCGRTYRFVVNAEKQTAEKPEMQ